MGESKKRWIIRDAAGRIDGPFSTEKILYKIGRGELSGEESVARYPDGRWIPISQDPDFYDKLLDVLASEGQNEDPGSTKILDFTQRPGPEDYISPDEAATVAIPRSLEGDEGTESGTSDGDVKPSMAADQPHQPGRRRKKRPKDIELVDSRPQYLKAVIKRARIPLIIIVLTIIAVAFLLEDSQQGDRIHLIAPQKGKEQLPAQELSGRSRQGLAAFLTDTLNGYLRAQNDFVYIVEHNSKDAGTMGLLCMTYLQLWPYAHQDSRDNRVITGMVQLTATVDPGGINASTCRGVDLIVRGRIQEAKGLVESVLDTRVSSREPPTTFYYLKGYLLAMGGDHATAIGYLQSAQQLDPRWLLPYVAEAQSLMNLNRASEAAKRLNHVLKANPSHSIARIELGLLEYKNFNHIEAGERLLTQGLGPEDAPRLLLSKGYFGLAEIALKRNDTRRALEFAQRAYSMNSANTTAKNLIVQLGGVEKLKRTKVKGQQLIFEGDQFFREGDCHAAQAHYKAAFEENPKNATAAMKAAKCLWQLSFTTEAMDWLNKAVKADPNLMEPYITLADYQAQRFNFVAAARVLESARRMNPKSYEVFRGFALVEMKRNNAKGAIQFAKRALQIYENDVETLIILSQASIALRDYKMAFNYAAKAIEIDVNHRQAQAVYAKALAGLQGVDVGIDYLLKLVNSYPLVGEYRLELGRMLLADERYSQAEEVFRQIVRLEEKPKEAYIELAKVMRIQNRNGEALDLLLKAAVLDPSDAEPLFTAGTIYLDLNQPDKALDQFRRVQTINKLYPLVHYQLGRAALLMNDPKAALGHTEAEARINPNLADTYLLAAEAHSKMHQYSLCAREYQKAIKLRPQEAAIYVRLAQCYRKAGTLDAAISMLNVAATKESGLADIYKEQGVIYELKGDVVHAIESYNQYFVLDPDAPDRTQIEARISALQSGRSP